MARDLAAELRAGMREVKATTEDDDGDSHETSIRVHHVNDDFKGHEVQTLSGVRTLRGGEWVVETGRPDVYDIHTDKEWQNNGYGADSSARGADSSAPSDNSGDDDDTVKSSFTTSKSSSKTTTK